MIALSMKVAQQVVLVHGTLCAVTALLLFRPVQTAASLTENCPEGCFCDTENHLNNVICNLTPRTTWDQFLSQLPSSTNLLHIRGAQFVSLETSLSMESKLSFPNLNYVKISHSHVTGIGNTAFVLFPDVLDLHIVNCDLEKVPAESLKPLINLKVLNISGNRLSVLDPDLLTSLTQLQVLDLHNNSLEDLPTGMFGSLAHLKELDLSGNGLEYILPESFSNLTALSKVYLHNNHLHALHSSVFTNLSSLQEVYLHENPWDCSCGLQWLRTKLTVNRTTSVFSSPELLLCSSPRELSYKPLHSVAKEELLCSQPEILDVPSDQEVMRLQTVVLPCSFSGYPQPSIYWVTPNGVLAKPHNRKYISADIPQFHVDRTLRLMPPYDEAKLTVLDDGSLEIHSMRHHFAGGYECVAENPAGIAVVGFNVTFVCVLQKTMVTSVIVGWIACGSFLVFGIVVGSLLMGIETRCGRRKKLIIPSDEEDPVDHVGPASDYTSSSEQLPSSRSSLMFYPSPDVSPMKCTTPAEDMYDDESMQHGNVNIRETLEDVRTRLRSGVTKSKERLRTRAHQIRESSTSYMSSLKENSTMKLQTLRENSTLKLQTLRHSSSQYMHHIRESSSQYAHRVRDGVVLGVEQVKYHVQSIKELCGTGDIGQTISTYSVATNVDSQEQTEVVRKITLV